MIPRHLITTWICAAEHDRYREEHRALFAHCLGSWLRLMPDYRLTIITLGNLWDWGRSAWVEAQVREGNYIGASNWARLRCLEALGGVYMDMDVEAVQRFDALLDRGFVVGHEGRPKDWVNNAVIVAEPGHPVLNGLLARVEACDPSDPQLGNNSGPRLVTRWLRDHGWSGTDAAAEVDGVSVLPSPAFYPYHYDEVYGPECLRPETIAVHHWAQTWFARAGLQEHGKCAR